MLIFDGWFCTKGESPNVKTTLRKYQGGGFQDMWNPDLFWKPLRKKSAWGRWYQINFSKKITQLVFCRPLRCFFPTKSRFLQTRGGSVLEKATNFRTRCSEALARRWKRCCLNDSGDSGGFQTRNGFVGTASWYCWWFRNPAFHPWSFNIAFQNGCSQPSSFQGLCWTVKLRGSNNQLRWR